jgi:hypothetical protein
MARGEPKPPVLPLASGSPAPGGQEDFLPPFLRLLKYAIPVTIRTM